MTDPTNLSDPVPAPPVARWSEPPAAPRRRPRLTPRFWLKKGAVGLGCAAVGATLALLSLRATPPEPARADTREGALRADGASIVLTARLAERLGVRTASVKKALLAPLVTTTGTVTFDPRYTAAVGTRLPGLIRSVLHFEGDLVTAGEGLAILEGAELGSAQADVLSLRAHESAASHSFDRERFLGERGLSSTRRIEAAAAGIAVLQSRRAAAEQRVTALGGEARTEGTERALGVHRLRSPVAGTIVERHVSAGESVDDHRVAFRVANLDHLWAELAASEQAVRGVLRGDSVEVCALASSECVSGVVAHVGEEVEPTTLVVVVRIEIDNAARRLRAGQAISAKIRPSGGAATESLVVPKDAVVRVDGQPVVFVETEGGRLVPTRVELAEGNERDQRVMSGLTDGQLIVTDGAPALASALFR